MYLIFTAKSLYIPNICCNFVADFACKGTKIFGYMQVIFSCYCLPCRLVLLFLNYLPMAAIAAANVFDMWQFSKTATDGLNTHMQ